MIDLWGGVLITRVREDWCLRHIQEDAEQRFPDDFEALVREVLADTEWFKVQSGKFAQQHHL